MKTTKIVYEVISVPVSDGATPRKCGMCLHQATREVYRAVKGRGYDPTSKRYACGDHATLEMYPVIVTVKLAKLPRRVGYQTPKGDQWMFYRDVMREVGGVVPMPDKETKEEIAEAKSCRLRRADNWPGPVVLPERKDINPYSRRYRLAGMSGRQWVKFRKKAGLARTAR